MFAKQTVEQLDMLKQEEDRMLLEAELGSEWASVNRTHPIVDYVHWFVVAQKQLKPIAAWKDHHRRRHPRRTLLWRRNHYHPLDS